MGPAAGSRLSSARLRGPEYLLNYTILPSPFLLTPFLPQPFLLSFPSPLFPLPSPTQSLGEEEGLCSVYYGAVVAAIERYLQETPQQSTEHWWKV